MKKLLLAISVIIPLIVAANNALEFEVVRTTETPGFFAITLFPAKDAQPLHERIVFIKNFSDEESNIYNPIVNFLTELGVKIISTAPSKSETIQVITLGDPLPNSENFVSHDEKKSLEQFEQFSVQNLKPVFFRNLRTEFGGNISSVTQSEKNIIGDNGVTFIGKFEKDIRTRMAIIADDETQSLQFEIPINLPNRTLSQSPFAKELPQLWEQLQIKNKSFLPSPSYSFLPWMIGGIALIVLVIMFIRHTLKKHREFLEEQDSLQE